ncbi:MAG: nitroreductase family protein [Treponema sp.]|jgi:nitroreductase|nr:nitroreductase family protein [Treponema sp.]
MKTTLTDLKARRSIRAYKPEQITDEELDAILEAGTCAPSGMGAQSAVMVVAQERSLVSKLEKLNAEALKDPGAKTFYGAPTVVNVLVDKTQATPAEDGVLVMGNLMNAAAALGIGSCWINRAREVFESAEGRALLGEWGLDEKKYTGIAHCILGYPAERPEAKPRKAGYIIKIKKG